MSRAAKAVVMVWLMVGGPLLVLAFLTMGLWLPVLITDPVERAVWGPLFLIGTFALMAAPWAIGSVLQTRGAAKAQRPADRSAPQLP